jgi:hypothetical protein
LLRQRGEKTSGGSLGIVWERPFDSGGLNIESYEVYFSGADFTSFTAEKKRRRDKVIDLLKQTGDILLATNDPKGLSIGEVDELCAKGTGVDEQDCRLGEGDFQKYCLKSFGCMFRRTDIDGMQAYEDIIKTKLDRDCTEEEYFQNTNDCKNKINGNFDRQSRPLEISDEYHYIKSGLVENTNYLFGVKAVQEQLGNSEKLTSDLSYPRLRLMTPAATTPGVMFKPIWYGLEASSPP